MKPQKHRLIYIFICGLFMLSSFDASAQVWSMLDDSLRYYMVKGNFQQGVIVGEKAVSAAKKEFGSKHLSYSSSANDLATCYTYIGKYERAETLYVESSTVRLLLLGKDHPDYLTSLSNLASVYGSMTKYTTALPLCIQVVDSRKRIFGEENADYVSSLASLAWVYMSLREYAKAEPLYLRSVELNKIVYGTVSFQYATSLNQLGWLYEAWGFYSKAEETLLESLKIRQKLIVETSEDVALSLSSLGGLYTKMNQFSKAESYLLRAIKIRKELVGEMHLDYANSIYPLALLYKTMGQYLKAEPLLLQVKNIRENNQDFSSSYYAEYLFQLALNYASTAQYQKASDIYKQLQMIMKSIYGEAHPYFAAILSGEGGLAQSLGEYSRAEQLYLRANRIVELSVGKEQSEYQTGISNLAVLYQIMGLFNKAEPLFLTTLAFNKKTFGQSSPEYANSLHNLAALSESIGEYEEAESLNVQALQIRAAVLGEAHPSYILSLNNLAWLYLRMGRYEKAEPLNLKALAITKKTSTENPLDYLTSLNNIAVLYKVLGQFDKAEGFYLECNTITKSILGEQHPDHAKGLHNLGELYQSRGNYTKAQPLLLASNEIWKKALGEDHPNYASSLDNIAKVYASLGQYDKAEALLYTSKNIREKIFSKSHPKYAQSLAALANCFMASGKNKEAEKLFIEANQVNAKSLGTKHTDYVAGLMDLAKLYASTGFYEKAEPLLLSASKIETENVEKVFAVLSEEEKNQYLAHNIVQLELGNIIQFQFPVASKELTINNFEQQLFFKSLSLSDTRTLKSSLENSTDSTTKKLYSELKQSKILLAKQYGLELSQRIANLDSVEQRTESLEKELTRRSTSFSGEQEAIKVSLAALQNNLDADEVAIEFVRFNLQSKASQEGKMYAAYILRKDEASPIFVPLCEEQQLGKYFSAGSGIASIKAIYRSDPVDENEKPSISGDSLYKLIWLPMMPHLKGINKINFAPVGLLHKVAFRALPMPDSSLILDKFELNQYISTRELALTKELRMKSNSIGLFGDCLFTMDSVSQVKGSPAPKVVNTFATAAQDRSGQPGGWKQLSGTADEVMAIAALFKSKNQTTQTYTQAIASEEQFKALSGQSPTILHLATHGFFLADPVNKKLEAGKIDERNAFTLADDPLLRSGIVLSGANRVWSGKPPIAGREDGILTAYEIAQLNLSTTELVVLSACETALGDIKGTEGVFGLQRAFKLAGVKNMLLSLWKVPDAETAELMTLFYTEYLQSHSARTALTVAQKAMRKKYPPYYWAAFVLIE